MKVLIEYLKEFQKLFDWYFQLTQIKRTQLNNWIVIAFLLYLTYKNDEQHRINYKVLSDRIDTINNARAKEQGEYVKGLEFFTKKYSDLFEKLLSQKQEIQQIKEKNENSN